MNIINPHKKEAGQGLVEYTLILVGVAMMVIDYNQILK